MSPFGKLISSGLEQRGWTQGQLAAQLKIRQQTVSRWLTAPTVQPRWDIVVRVAQLFGWDLDLVVRTLAGDAVEVSTVTTADEPGSGSPTDAYTSFDLIAGFLADGPNIPLDRVAEVIKGTRVLITGGAGWIGSNLAVRIAEFDPAHVLVADRDGSVVETVDDLGGNAQPELADVDHQAKITKTITDWKPDIVFHVAGYPESKALQRSPAEATRGHLCGLWHVLRASIDSGVPRFVAVSSPKAAQPLDVKGQTKLLAERLIAGQGQPSYCSLRFGSLFDSPNGEVARIRNAASKGGPLSIPPRGAIRCFLRTRHAIDAMLLAAATARDTPVLALPFGLRMSLHDVALRIVHRCDVEVAVTFDDTEEDSERLEQNLIGPTEQATEVAGGGPLIALRSDPEIQFDNLDTGRGQELKAFADQGMDDAARRLLEESVELVAPASRPLR